MRYVGNLDLYRTWERTLRRAGAPLVYSKGFHPAPKMQLASALPLGITSEAELLDIWLIEGRELYEFVAVVSDVLPSGIEIIDVKEVDLNESSLQSCLCAVEYTVDLSNICPVEVLERKVAGMLDDETIIRHRRGRDYDLRKLIECLSVEHLKDDDVILRMRLTSRPGSTGRAEEVLAAMDITGGWIHRTGLFFVDKDV